jgi:hypothetical protein
MLNGRGKIHYLIAVLNFALERENTNNQYKSNKKK